MVKAVIFDMDGVLIDTEKYLVKYWCEAAKEAGYDMQPEQAYQIRSLAAPFAEPLLQTKFGKDFDYQKIRARRKEKMAAHIAKNGIEKKAGVTELLQYLKQKKIKTAVATATDEERTHAYLGQIGIEGFFDEIICATMVKNGKPKPDIYLYALEKIQLPKEVCLAVEDSPNGIKAATDAGIRTIMVPDLTQPDVESKRRVFAVADTLLNVIPLVEKENKKI
ncbi:MAG: HAD family hydrolase [Lachnospiraceae bacterium]